MKNLVLIGAGQLGSRHLQALSRVNYHARIAVVDPLTASLHVARSRFNEMEANPNIIGVDYYSSLNEIPREIDLVILATNADIRAELIRTLMRRCQVKNLILEKVLFQKLEDYANILSLLERTGTNAWVNHPKRLYPFYKKLKQSLDGCDRVFYQVCGGAWGLACNGLHMIDHLAFLVGGGQLQIDTSGLDPFVIPSKRPGCLEVTGSLEGQIGSHSFNLFCHQEPSREVITICSDHINAIVDEGSGWARSSSKENNWKWIEEKKKIEYFQSELTNKVTEDIFESGRCDLPTLADASALHIPFIRAMLDHINRYDDSKHITCPIT